MAKPRGLTGKYKPAHPEKYKGDIRDVWYRSQLELSVMRYFDRHRDVVSWGSENTVIPYVKPTDGATHRYFPDFTAEVLDRETGEIRRLLIEVKPQSKLKPPKKKITRAGKPTVWYLREVAEYAVNRAKFEAAERYCQNKGFEFMILTEKEIRKTA